MNGNRRDLDIPAGISIVILADGNNASTFHDNYGDVNVRAPLVFEEGARLVMNYKTPLLGGASGRGVISAASGNDERIFAGEGAIAAGANAPTVGTLTSRRARMSWRIRRRQSTRRLRRLTE